MDALREEVGIHKCLMGRLVNSRLKLAGHVERMKEDRLPTRRERFDTIVPMVRLLYVLCVRTNTYVQISHRVAIILRIYIDFTYVFYHK